jgi:hypothetical protein
MMSDLRAIHPTCHFCVLQAQDESYETPMQPITMLRNALGREEGGSGVPLNKAEYEKSVAYWETHATLVAGNKPNGE